MSQVIGDLRELIHQIEQISDEIAKKYDVEHLAGPQGYVLVFLAKHQNQEIFVKDIEKQLRISKSVASHLVTYGQMVYHVMLPSDKLISK
ncbi:marR family protein [Streptococcus pyogenes]|nr:marR family protein [Streptococcus pyogenes]